MREKKVSDRAVGGGSVSSRLNLFLAVSLLALAVANMCYSQPISLQMHLNAAEVSGVSSGSTVTPSIAPAGFTGMVVANGGSVNFTPVQSGNGVYFLNCCQNFSNAYYKFTGAALGNIFNVNQGQITFYLKSRYSFAQRQVSARSPRYAFDVRDADTNHLFYFFTEITPVGTEDYLLFTWRVGNSAVGGYVSYFYWVDSAVADALFGNGVTLKVTLTWDGSTDKMYFNDVLVQTFAYTKATPTWSASSVFDLGAFEFVNYGGYNTLDDAIAEFTVQSPPTSGGTPPTVAITSPTNGSTVNGTVLVTANATDKVAMQSVQFKLDGANLGSLISGPGPVYSLSVDTTKISSGTHVLTAFATNTSGLTALSSPIQVTVNNPPVVSGVTASGITSTSAIISWTTDKPASSQIAYGLTSSYGSSSPLDPTLVTSHNVVLSGLTPSTIYHYQAQSKDAQGGLGVSVDFSFTTAPTGGTGPVLQMHLNAAEVNGVTTGSKVTPSVAPAGFTGTVVANGGSVNFTPVVAGNGVYFLTCCQNFSNAYYKFTGAALGNIFNVNQGKITFYLKSRYSFAQRQVSARSPRYAFDVRDADTNHLFYFFTEITPVGTEDYLLFTWRVGNSAVGGYVSYFYWVDSAVADALFGNGVTLKVTLTWDGSTDKMYFNDVLVQTFAYTKATPTWSASSVFDLGAFEFVNYGGYNILDDAIAEFTVYPM